MDKIKIKTIEKQDIPDVTILLRKHAEYHEKIEPEHFTSQQSENLWFNYIKEYGDTESARILVAFNGSKMIGLMAGRIENQRSILSKPPLVGLITRAFVEEGYRGRGVSTLLLEAMLPWFKGHDIEFVQVGSLELNGNSTEAWKRLGFRMYSHKLELRI